MDRELRLGVGALSLAERRAILQGASRARLSPEISAEAARTVQWWERTYFRGSSALFTRRLRADGLNRRTVLPLVAAGRTAGADVDAGLPGWPLDAQEVDRSTEHGVLVANGWLRVEAAIQTLEQAGKGLRVDRGALRAQFADHLVDRLNAISIRTFAVELHLARMSGRLRGASPSARFREWVEANVLDPEAYRRLLVRYPGLLRALVTATVHTTEAWEELLVRLGADWASMAAAFGRPGGGEVVVSVEPSGGDTHRQGRSVMFVGFGTGWRVVYKPRPMAVDAHFYELLTWLAARELDPAPRPLTVLDRGDHGWMEVAAAAGCRTPAEVRAFYRRQGALLMVLHLLDGVDSHAENVIAAGEHPVLVDLEALFQVSPADASGPVRRRVFDATVLKTGMLPIPRTGTVGRVDLAGLAETSGQRTAHRVPDWHEFGTDRMRLVSQQMDMQGLANTPRLDDRPVPVGAHVEDIVDGFTQAYRLVVALRGELGAPDGPLAAFRDDQVRYVLRNTSEYGVLLDGSYHPSCLRDAIQRDFVFDCLWLQAAANPHLAPVIASEREDLWAGDIPQFSARVSSRDLVDARGAVLPGFLASTGYEQAEARLRGLDEADLARQVACIRGTISASSPAVAAPAMVACADREATDDELLAAAVEIGERLAVLALRHGDQAFWTGQVGMPGQEPMWNVVGCDLYEGTAGIALFLAHLAAATGREDFEELARAATADVVAQIPTADLAQSTGAFTGVPGLMYALAHLSAVWDDPKLGEVAVSLLDRPVARTHSTGAMDLLTGVAGCVLVLLRLARQFPACAPRALELATRHGRALLRSAVRVDEAMAWPPPGPGAPLTGLSHGVAGIAWALGELSVATGDARFGRAAAGALRYERQLFDPDLGNWPDFRVFEEAAPGLVRRQYLWGWCHGAPGIGLARLMLRRHCPEVTPASALDAEVAAALASTEANGFNDGHCLCHGDLGNAELLLTAAAVYGEPRYRQEARRRARAVLLDHQSTGAWRCNRTDFTELPGLMMGIAGIGYQLLRLRHPEGVPSVLTLEGPA